MPSSTSALGGIRVIDFTHFIAGPFCTMILGDLGAEVIKIEGPKGDTFRNFKPHVQGEGAPFLWVNRNKSGVVLDFASKDGARLVRELIATADVVVENFSSGVMKRYGLDYESLARINPKLIYCSISAYGRQGALADRVGFDPVVQAETGFMSMNGHPDQEMTRTGPAIMDMSTGMMAANAVLGALVARERNGKGQYVEAVLYDTAATMVGFHAMNWLVSGINPTRFGNSSPDSAPMGMFQASDGPFYLACANDGLFKRLAENLPGGSELVSASEFSSPALRVENRTKLTKVLNVIFATATRETWVEKLRKGGIPAGIPRTVEEAFQSSEMKARDLVTTIDHPTAGKIPNIALPIKLEGTPLSKPVAAPMLGQHTADILRTILGLSAQQISELESAGTIATADHRVK
jgi:crotonobetainyl-CoA:carnitine CoA-transferase CaiB-like acyl-CoA transferase